MIWTPTPPPCIGERRVVRRFAWWPVTLINGARLWLESYYALEAWQRVDLADNPFAEWDDCEWRTVSRTTFDPTPTLNGGTP